MSDFLAQSNRTVVLQDVAALDVLEQVIADEEQASGTYQELSVNIDTGGLAARRIIAAQTSATTPAPATR